MRKSSRDPLQVQISAHVKAPNGRRITGDVLREAIAYRIREGRNPKGIELRIIAWKNPGRKNPALRDWRTDDTDEQTEAWNTLGNALLGWVAEAGDIEVDFG